MWSWSKAWQGVAHGAAAIRVSQPREGGLRSDREVGSEYHLAPWGLPRSSSPPPTRPCRHIVWGIFPVQYLLRVTCCL